ncbi:ankyrin repeat and zinc finger domain-containing protein 1 isoform X1 [Oncorhynchus kisutch]|uniref:Ankyrin repeat and zinc finger peptidyl tRNA hydrolase 1 n=1 Tax=Oncorhynchus kisutch TaxID=8019 RepID=A0A8C7KDZ6_ONCKI|nr:ankyrin repeat and zinc finger domain-containing protein 1 isoform X1 [Oncorhynchus kisutch]XP_031661981.1 ankyrin repeat and zinc finger domain-containing protein 1 isoform X1 [Oncorhynchus kisutch]XP_031661982.1 ankyrin repeat and zinc finger domain-containing protein 1 isoform X1 [Oncorhynchus kisutch]
MTAGPEHRSVFEYCLQDSALQEVREVTSVHEPPVHTKNPPHSHGVTVCPKEDLQDDKQPESSLGRDVSDRMVCSACQCPFDTREEQMEHYKLDWHRFNLRQRPSGKAPATVEEFERKTGGGDMSSISGSDSEDEEPDSDWVVENTEAAPLQKDHSVLEAESFGRLSNRVVFQNSQGQYLAVYRCVLQSKSAIEEDLVASLQSLSNKTMWVILMAGGGHFAGAVFQGREVLQHKTFHRYTVRAKRGTAQGLRDAKNSSHAPKSAGAALRRYNESALVKEIQDLLDSWSDHLTDASAIFLRAPSHNKTLFLGGKAAPLVKRDPRIRTLPFPTRRATFREIKRVHDVLSTLNIYGKDTDISDILSPSNKVWKKARTPVAQPEPSQETTAPLVEEEESSGEELETVEVTLGTLDLREHEIYPARRKKRRRRTEDRGLSNREAVGSPAAPEDSNQERGGERNQGRRKPKGKMTIQHEEEEPDESWDYGLRDALYTACKTGDLDTLIRLLPVRRGEEGDQDGQREDQGDRDGQREDQGVQSEDQGAKQEGEKNQGELKESCSSKAPAALSPLALLNQPKDPAAQSPLALLNQPKDPAAQSPLALLNQPIDPAAQSPLALLNQPIDPAAQSPLALLNQPIDPAALSPLALLNQPKDPAAQSPLALLNQPKDPAAQSPLALLNQPIDPAAQSPLALLNQPIDPAAQSPLALLNQPKDPAAQSPLALLNQPIDSSGFTLLHVASAAGQKGVVQLLMDAGSDPACKDLTGQTPYIVAPDKDTRNVFRKYMADHPDKYNYSKALVPGPLTAELESKKTEKKRAQKAAKKTREKEQKEQRKRLEMEAEEKKRFASLSDREKRAQAAEKRLAEHQSSTGETFQTPGGVGSVGSPWWERFRFST